jgi:hypothetical protein
VPAKQTGKKHGKGTVKAGNGFASVACKGWQLLWIDRPPSDRSSRRFGRVCDIGGYGKRRNASRNTDLIAYYPLIGSPIDCRRESACPVSFIRSASLAMQGRTGNGLWSCSLRLLKSVSAQVQKLSDLNRYQATCPSIPGHTSFTVMTSVNAWSCRLVLQKSSNTSDTCQYRPGIECLTQDVDQAPCQG